MTYDYGRHGWQYVRAENHDTEDNPRAHIIRAKGWVMGGVDGGGSCGAFTFAHHIAITPCEEWRHDDLEWEHGADEYGSLTIQTRERARAVQFHLPCLGGKDLDTLATAVDAHSEIDLKIIAINMPLTAAGCKIVGWGRNEMMQKFWRGEIDQSDYRKVHEIYTVAGISQQNCVSVEKVLSVSIIKPRSFLQKAAQFLSL